MGYGTMQCSMIWYSATMYDTVQHNVVQYGTTQFCTIWYSAMLYHMVQPNVSWYGSTQFCAPWSNAMLYDMVQCNVVRYGTTQCCTIWHKAMLYDMVERRRTCGKEWVESTQMPLGIHQRAGHYRNYPLDNSFLISTYKYHWTHAQSQKCLYISNQQNRLTHYHRLNKFNQKCQSQQEVRVQYTRSTLNFQYRWIWVAITTINKVNNVITHLPYWDRWRPSQSCQTFCSWWSRIWLPGQKKLRSR